ALREELVELLDGDTGGLAEDADRGAGALGLVLGAHEPDDLPVPRRQLGDALGPGDLRRHLLGPLAGIGEESFVVDWHVVAGVGDDGHGGYLPDETRAGRALPRAGMAGLMPGISRPGSRPCQ